jgi:hypothetical protein
LFRAESPNSDPEVPGGLHQVQKRLNAGRGAKVAQCPTAVGDQQTDKLIRLQELPDRMKTNIKRYVFFRILSMMDDILPSYVILIVIIMMM